MSNACGGNISSHIWMQPTTVLTWQGSRALSLIGRDVKIIRRKRSHTACVLHLISSTATVSEPQLSFRPFHTFTIPHRGTHRSLAHRPFTSPANRIGCFIWKNAETPQQQQKKKQQRREAVGQIWPHSLVAGRRLRRSARWLHTAHSAQTPHHTGACRLSQSLVSKYYKADYLMTFRLHDLLITQIHLSLKPFTSSPEILSISLGEFDLFWGTILDWSSSCYFVCVCVFPKILQYLLHNIYLPSLMSSSKHRRTWCSSSSSLNKQRRTQMCSMRTSLLHWATSCDAASYLGRETHTVPEASRSEVWYSSTAEKPGWVQPFFHWSQFKCEKVKNNENYTSRSNKNRLCPMMLSQWLWWNIVFLLSVYLWGCLKKYFDNISFRPQISLKFTSCVNLSADMTDIRLSLHRVLF